MSGQCVEYRQFCRDRDITLALREQLAECWLGVANAGGAVLAPEFGRPPVRAADVSLAVDRLLGHLDPRSARLLVAVAPEAETETETEAAVEAAVAGWLIVRRDMHPLVAHCGVVNHVQTHLKHRGRGIGVELMRRVRDVAREEMGLERLRLSTRGGMGLEGFYRRLRWVEVGRWPGLLRLAPGDDRDEILMDLPL
ncbi:GNAT family N-acetyltransferase [Streptomyces sp. HNM0663]|uniref:GNAT family N-acetyltransferase n=1 Tax=Streptomyces chengmaiensis TaxID=3040919 RepID=A0ABT6HJ84_9ACTN|nr:GNAT family N-acetyltransferase [Streptomyces chengmaiensis]MDH2388375.1 GNAT family N-acetyltransferase [Streptomyces chengmaiensis]